MATKTEQLAEITLQVDPATTTPGDVLAQVAAAQGWAPPDSLLRLEGFEDPWERALFKGRELRTDEPLAAQGVTASDAPIVTVRRVLIADGWKIQVDENDDDTDSEEEEF